MRELTKSMLSFSLAIPIFGMKQMVDIAMPRDPSRPFGKATDSFDAVTGATAAQMDGGWRGAFQAGDRLQRGMVDLMLGVFTGDSFDFNRMMRMSSDMLQTSMGAVGRGLGDCGCGGSSRGAAAGSRAAGSPAAATPYAPPSGPPPSGPPFGAPPISSPRPPEGAASSPAAAGALNPPPGWTVSVPNV